MPILLMILKKYWKHILIVIVILAASAYFYNKIYTLGFDAANVECAQRMKEYTEKLDARIAAIEEASSTLVTEAIDARAVRKKDFATILSTIKNKPLYTVVEGKCTPTEDLIRIYNEAVDRANKP